MSTNLCREIMLYKQPTVPTIPRGPQYQPGTMNVEFANMAATFSDDRLFRRFYRSVWVDTNWRRKRKSFEAVGDLQKGDRALDYPYTFTDSSFIVPCLGAHTATDGWFMGAGLTDGESAERLCFELDPVTPLTNVIGAGEHWKVLNDREFVKSKL
ncbi:hypothetical protein C8R43DRAFT_946411 [Mycena crocata]|nr:hypothetical protein C8R43DRAFT_946411 [Mycena crocata]